MNTFKKIYCRVFQNCFKLVIPILLYRTPETLKSTSLISHICMDNHISKVMVIPDYAVLDPKPTLSLPPFITACTGMDALSHAIEAYIGNSTTKKTRAYALKVTKLIFENIYKVYEDGNDLEARSNMFDAAFYAGHAFTVSYVDMCRRLFIHWVKNIILRMD